MSEKRVAVAAEVIHFSTYEVMWSNEAAALAKEVVEAIDAADDCVRVPREFLEHWRTLAYEDRSGALYSQLTSYLQGVNDA